MSSFDYYQASVETSPDHVIGALHNMFPFSSVDVARATNGYEAARLIHRGDNKLALIQWGGNTGNAVQIRGTGENAPACASAIRELWPQHRLQRADVAEDYSEEGVWETMTDYGLYLATKHDLKVDQRGDWARNDEHGKGRTLYLGARQSRSFLRIYEKGKERAVRSGNDCIDPNLVRAEAEIKPQNKQQGYQLATLEPHQYWGVSEWLREYSTILFQKNMERVRVSSVKRLTDDDMGLDYMLKQYGGVLYRQAGANGMEWLLDTIRDAVEKYNVTQLQK